jgi:hypothetical protein
MLPEFPEIDDPDIALIHLLGRAMTVSASVLRAYWQKIGKNEKSPAYWQEYQNNVIIQALQAYDKFLERQIDDRNPQ